MLLCLILGACSAPPAGDDSATRDLRAAPERIVAADLPSKDVGGPDLGAADRVRVDGKARTTFVAVTFNTGTTADTSTQAPISDQYYGNGLAWTQAVNDTRSFFAQVDADVVVFQEIFYLGDCAGIPASAQLGYLCETWKPGDPPSVAQFVLGPGWQVACHPGKPDKCAAVNKRFGTFHGCVTDYCATGLTGFTVTDCGKGARVARGVIDRVEGGTLTLVSVHGSSGITSDDQGCRVKQVGQVFVDLGDGSPGANGTTNLIMGDLNTDPVRMAFLDKSAAEWSSFVGPGKKFHFITDVGLAALPTYAGLFNIDHVISDALVGSCWTAGATPGHPPVIQTPYFDHKPAVCTIDRSKP